MALHRDEDDRILELDRLPGCGFCPRHLGANAVFRRLICPPKCKTGSTIIVPAPYRVVSRIRWTCTFDSRGDLQRFQNPERVQTKELTMMPGAAQGHRYF